MKCDNILVVANITRAITDQSLKSSLFKVLPRHVPLAWEESAGKGLNVAVGCPRSEVMIYRQPYVTCSASNSV